MGVVTCTQIKGLHARIFLVICAAAFPLLVGSAYYLYRQADLIRSTARIEANQYLKLAAEYARAEILGAGEALAAISTTPAVQGRKWSLCDEYLGRLIALRPARYSNIGVVGLDGGLLCSGVPASPGQVLNFADRSYFRLALQRPGLSVGDYQRGRLTGLPSVAVAMAMRDETGKPFAVVFASLRLSSLERGGAGAADTEAHITVLDRNGLILQGADSLIGDIGAAL